MKNYDLGFACREEDHPCLDSVSSSENISFCLQYEIHLLANTRMTLGWRLDKATDQDAENCPRLGLIHNFKK